MSFEFNSPLFIKTIDTGEEIILGSFNLPNTLTGIIEQKYMTAFLNVENMTIVNERLKMQIHGEATCNSLIAESDYFDINLITGVSPSWNGLIRFDFDSFPLNLGVDYYMKIIPYNYTRASKTSYLALSFNWPIANTTNTNATPWLRPLTFEPYLRMDVQ